MQKGHEGEQVHPCTITPDGSIPFQLRFRWQAGREGRRDPAVRVTVAEANLAEMEGEMEKAHLLH